jgi:two-component system cell cycle sensor histidine kinase/response regulator CckA
MGARFIVDLPPSLDTPASVSTTEASHTERGSETILLVEDEQAVRDFCKRALEMEGYRVVAAGPNEALDHATALGPDLDLLVTDVVMPDLDGPTLAAAITRNHAGLKVLFMSGYPRDLETELRGQAAGIGVLGKPFSARELSEAVRQVLDRPAGTDDTPGDQRRVRP